MEHNTYNQDLSSEFMHHSELEQTGLVREFLDFLKHNKKWWLLPIVISIGLLSALVIFGGSPAAPFIYTLF